MPYRSAHHALVCLFVDHSRPAQALWQKAYNAGFREPRETPPAQLLHGMEEVAGEAAIVWKHLAKLGDTRAAILILAVCPPRMRHPSIPSATIEHPAYQAAAHWLAMESLQAVNGISMYRARSDAVQRACGKPERVNVGMTADACGKSRRTIERVNRDIRDWINPIKLQAWREIEDRLEAAALIDVVAS